MVKFIGISVTALCCVICGFLKSYRLSLRESVLEEAVTMIRLMEIELAYNAPDTVEMLRRICSKQKLKKIGFIKKCIDSTGEKPFSEAWNMALYSDSSLCLDTEDKSVLDMIGSHLGSTDMAGQLAGLKNVESRLLLRLEDARIKSKKESGLYRTLGVLAGIGTVIITI